MKQVCLRDVKTIAVEETDVPQAVGNKVLIKTKATGICGTDVHSYMGESIFGKLFPFHIGHEAAGIVEATGPDCTRIRPGDHVVIDPLMELTQGMGGDVVFEASGSVHTTRLTSQLVKVGGKIVLVGLAHAPVDYDFFSVARKEVDIFGVFRYVNMYPLAREAISSGSINVRPVVSHKFRFEKVQQVFETAVYQKNEATKVMIEMAE